MVYRGWRARLETHKGWAWIVAVLAVVIFWLWRGTLYQAAGQAPEPQQTAQQASGTAGPALTLQVQTLSAESYQPRVVLQGQLQARQHLVVRARVEGVIEQLPALGKAVNAGDILLKLSVDDRQAALTRAEAEQALRQAELKAAERLRRKGLLAETDYLTRQSAAAQADAALSQARLALDYSRPKAPFAGTVDDRHVEVGDYVRVGDELLTLVDTSELKLTASVPQQKVAELTPGLPVTATLLDGRELEGSLTFVASAADVATRSFAVEARFANPQGLRLAGASAELLIALPARPAHRLSPALLMLDERGRPGVPVVDEQDRLQLLPVTLLAITPDEAWIAGLPEQARVVIRGAGFAEPGDKVRVRETGQ